jgi:hypothetical protein
MAGDGLIEKASAVLRQWYADERPAPGADRSVVCAGLAVLERVRLGANLPLRPEDYLTKKNQVRTGGPLIKRILRRHGETRLYSREGGRTTRGTRPAAERFVERLNPLKDLATASSLEREQVADALQRWLVENAVRDYFNRQQIEVEISLDKPGPQIIADILEAADLKNQCGPVAQHLVGAKLSLRYPHLSVENYSYTTADQQLGRPGDFVLSDTVFHVTVAPMPSVVDKCGENIRHGYRTMLLVSESKMPAARAMAETAGLQNRIGIASIEAFVGQHLEEMGEFGKARLAANTHSLLLKYNERVLQSETDRSLLIEVPENLL